MFRYTQVLSYLSLVYGLGFRLILRCTQVLPYLSFRPHAPTHTTPCKRAWTHVVHTHLRTALLEQLKIRFGIRVTELAYGHYPCFLG